MEHGRWTWYYLIFCHEDCYAQVNFIGMKMALFMCEESEATLACCCLRTILQCAWPLTTSAIKDDPLREVWVHLTPERLFERHLSGVRSNDSYVHTLPQRPER